MVRAVCIGPDCTLHCIKCFTICKTINDLLGESYFLRKLCVNVVGTCILILSKLLTLVFYSITEINIVNRIDLTLSKSCLESCLKSGKVSEVLTLCSTPVTVCYDCTDMIFSLFGCVVIVILKVTDRIPCAGICTCFKVDTVAVYSVTCFVLKKELKGSCTGCLIKGTVEISCGYEIGCKSSTVCVLELLDNVVTVFVLNSITCRIALINNAYMAYVVTTVVTRTNILEGSICRSTCNSNRFGISEVTVICVKIADLLLCRLIGRAVSVKLKQG